MTRRKNQRLWSAVIKGFITDKLRDCAVIYGKRWMKFQMESFKFEEDSLNTNHFFHHNDSP